MLAIVCPGQGAQKPGFMKPWLELEAVRTRMEWLSSVSGIDLVTHGTTSPQEVIIDTAVAQPLIVAAGVAVLAALAEDPADLAAATGVTAGHSVGEVTAAHVAGVIGAEEAMVLVTTRGRAMAAAAGLHTTGMSAVVGGSHAVAAIEAAGLVAANRNAPDQVVAAGPLDLLDQLRTDPPPGSRVVPLAVAGAFHTTYMTTAQDEVAACARRIRPRDARVPLLSNADGAVLHAGRTVLDRLVDQVTAPVRWDLCSEALDDMGVTGLLELTPAGTLTGLAKRSLPSTERVALRTPADLDAARALLADHGGLREAGHDGLTPSWRLVVAPRKGVVRALRRADGPEIASGEVVAVIAERDGDRDVPCTEGGSVVEWLVHEGDPVRPGQPLARLQPSPA